MTSHSCGGGDGYNVTSKPAAAWKEHPGVMLQGAVIDHLKARSPFTPALDGRIVVEFHSGRPHLDLHPLMPTECGDTH
eukprot:gene32992-66945_t